MLQEINIYLFFVTEKYFITRKTTFAGPWLDSFVHFPVHRLLKAENDPDVRVRLYDDLSGALTFLSDSLHPGTKTPQINNHLGFNRWRIFDTEPGRTASAAQLEVAATEFPYS